MANHEQQRNTEERKERFLQMAGLIGTFGAGAFSGSKREKLTLSMDADELRQVDLMVEQGLYASREAFLQSAARNLLRQHGVDVSQATPSELPMGKLTVAGMLMHNRKSLERLRAAGRQLELNVTGIFRLSSDVTPELACAVIKSLKVCGAFQASPEVKAALIDRTH
jgi:Arc/MetJ-type ribon-helix-helix transcriptional regulator